MGAVLVLMFLLQAWDKEVRLNVPNLGVFLGTRGFVENSPVYIFRAIPFARGTSGHQRFSYYSFAAEDLATALGCPREDAGEQLLCLRNARARDIVLATSERSRFFGPTQEPNVHLAAAVAGRRFLLGTVMGEGSHNLDIVARKPGNLQQNLIEFLQTVHHINHSTELAEVYRNSDFLPDKGDSNSRWAMELLGDVAYTCPLLRLGQALAAEGRNQVYGYVFDHRPSFTLFNESARPSRFAELDFVFGRPLDLSRKGTPEERELSRRMIDIWASFAHSGYGRAQKARFWHRASITSKYRRSERMA
ncbi:hypothetical protein V5799_004535 [Amblyomma americanum]|uniref:Carboxylesterase type B domain-containing protein n=1 Tax=Amblyomma americanum TaxID=6943 RepID=A0AAQ4D5U5_AMBAM